MAQNVQHDHDMKMYGEIKLYAGSGSPDLAQKIADYLKQKLSPREVIVFPNENIFIKLNSSTRGQDVIEQSRLPGTEETGDDCHRNARTPRALLPTTEGAGFARLKQVECAQKSISRM
jgi:hypothetical protein